MYDFQKKDKELAIKHTIEFFKKTKQVKDLIVGYNKKLIMSVDIINNEISYLVFINNVSQYASEEFETALRYYEDIK